MLIPSHRHTPADLGVWRALEKADSLVGDRPSGHVTQSLDALAFFPSPGFVGVSWGKDSVVVAHLAALVIPHVPLMHLRPTNHNPECDAVRDAYFSRPDARCQSVNYVEIPVDYSGVDRSAGTALIDRETDRAWYAAIRGYERAVSNRHVLGIRAEESTGRRMRFLRWGLESANTCAPIGYWSTQQVFGYLACHDLPVHPAYAMLGGGRWKRDRIRVAEIGDTHGSGGGRSEWEREYYGDVIRRMSAG